MAKDYTAMTLDEITHEINQGTDPKHILEQLDPMSMMYAMVLALSVNA